jgi:Zn-dependent peptidase ImmA (M78 family)
MAKTDEGLEDIARGFLKRIGLENQARPDLMTVITKVKHINPAFNYARIPDHEMTDVEAQWDSEKFVLRMRESVFVGMQRGEPRACMTVWHELSHMILKHEGILNRRAVRSGAEVAVARIRIQESEARRLAAVLMAPEHLASDEVTVDGLREMFGLSDEAAIYRKEEIEAVRRRRRGEKRPLPQSVVDFLREAQRRGHPIQTKLDE